MGQPRITHTDYNLDRQVRNVSRPDKDFITPKRHGQGPPRVVGDQPRHDDLRVQSLDRATHLDVDSRWGGPHLRLRWLLGERFLGEGYRKAWARLRHEGIRTSQRRVLRLMREAGLLAPSRLSRILGPRNHDGVITTERPDEMWGTDLTSVMTLDEGQATVFIAVDHCTSESVGIHAAKEANRFEALEPLRQGVRSRFGAYGADAATGLSIRHDHGSQYVSNAFQDELRFLGATSSPAFVRAPEGNGCAERFIRTLKEQLLWVKTFRTIEDLRLALHEWIAIYNREWLVAKPGYRTPAQVRIDLTAATRAA